MNKFILSIFLCLSIFSSVQSFAHEEELTKSEQFTQLLENLNGYIKKLSPLYDRNYSTTPYMNITYCC